MENNWARRRLQEPSKHGFGRPLSAAKRAILDLFLDQPEPLTLASIVRVTGLHENTVREHLTELVRRGMVTRHPSDPQGRGRPAWRYELNAAHLEGSEYAGLAAALASSIARTSTDPRGTAVAAGEEWGRSLVQDAEPQPLSPSAARSEVVRLLDSLGYEPQVEPRSPEQVILTRCPLLETAYRHEEVVCAVHLGIVRGALERYGADPEGTSLVPFSAPGACTLVVPPTDSTRESTA